MTEPRPAASPLTCTCGPWFIEGDPMFRTTVGSWHEGSCPLNAARAAASVTPDLRAAAEDDVTPNECPSCGTRCPDPWHRWAPGGAV